ncbi:MAG: hypothetical protein Kow0099_16650 [Candidatus Abyssubacteria bacterium]
MTRDADNKKVNDLAESLLLTAPKKLLKPRLQNKLILAFVSTAVISIALSTYLVIRITAEITEHQIERKIEDATATMLSMIDTYEEQAVRSLEAAIVKPGLFDALKSEKMSYVFTPPISSGTKAPIGLWVPTGQPVPGTGPPLVRTQAPPSATKTVMETEINGIQTLLAGAVMPITEEGRQYGMLAIGYPLGKSFAQDVEIMTGADIRIFYEKIPAGPSSILFKGSSARVSEDALIEIQEVASVMRERPDLTLIVEGHTDSTGSERHNYLLGLKRAEAVKTALVKEGIQASRIQTISFGETRAVALETDEESRALNRRVELEFKSHEDSLVGAIQDLPMTSAIKKSIFVDKQRYYDRHALLKGEPYRAAYQPLVGYGGKVLGLIFVGIPHKYTFAAAVATWHFFPVILAFGFLFATVLGYTISRGISRPIRILYRKVLAVAEGDLDQQFEAQSKDEIGDLGRAFNIMTRKLRQLRELEQEIQRRNRLAALGELSAGVAHEIRNPLGIIKNSAEMLRDRIQDNSKRRELTDFIIEEVDRLNRVVTNFLQFARPSQPCAEPIDINSVVEHSLVFVTPEIEPGSITIKKMLATNLPLVMADSEQCHQVFLNLFMNALQAMNGSGTLTVETRISESDASSIATHSMALSPPDQMNKPMVDIVISDTGEGIAPELLPRIFDPFFSTKDDGVGLGLSLVHKIVENHNGRIRVNSVPGAGTTFVISLPTASREDQ